MGILIVSIDWSIFNFSQNFFKTSLSDWIFKNDVNGILFLIAVILPAFIFNYFILFKNNKYLEYDAEFDEMNSDEKRKETIISVIITSLILGCFFYSFKYMR